MPNLDGLQSTRLIRQMGYSAPIVALSAFAEESNIKDCIDSGMNMFLRSVIAQHTCLAIRCACADLNYPVNRSDGPH